MKIRVCLKYFVNYCRFEKVSLPAIFLKDIYTNSLSIVNVCNEQSDLFKILSSLNKDRKSSEKAFFLKKFRNFAQSKRRCS